MALTLLGTTTPDLSDVNDRIAATHALAEQAVADASHAEATGQNARTMVLNRDPKLSTLEQTIAALTQAQQQLDALGQSYAAALPASLADRQALHAQADAMQATLTSLQSALATEVQARTAGDSALQVAVAALQQLKVIVGYGVTNLPASIAAGAVIPVTVTLSRNMGSASYSYGYGLNGGASLLGSLVIVGVTAQAATSLTVQVRNTGSLALVASAASVQVVTARDAA